MKLNYLSKDIKLSGDFLAFEGNDLPSDYKYYILDKGGCGVGGTTIALTNDVPYVIAAPTKGLGESKTKSFLPGRHLVGNKEVFVVSGRFADLEDDLKDYILNGGKKIITTYKSFTTLHNHFGEMLIAKNFTLLADEAHSFTTYGKLMDNGSSLPISNITRHFREYNRSIFMTATPLFDNQLPEEMKQLNRINIKFNNDMASNIYLQPTNKPIIKLINDFIIPIKKDGFVTFNGQIYDKLYIAVDTNSTGLKIIKNANLTDSEVRYICTNSAVNREKMKSVNCSISTINDAEKTFNFFTKKIFEGVDIYTEKALMIVVTNVTASKVRIDPLTGVKQIAGRFRNKNGGFYNSVIHITSFKPIEKDAATYAESIEANEELITYLSQQIYQANLFAGNGRNFLKEDLLSNPKYTGLISEDANGKLKINTSYNANIIFDYQMKQIYSSVEALTKFYQDPALRCNVKVDEFAKLGGTVRRAGVGFQKKLKRYFELANILKTNEFGSLVVEQDEIEALRKDPVISAVAKADLTLEECSTLRFKKDAILKAAIVKNTKIDCKAAIRRLLATKLKLDAFNSAKDVKNALAEVYKVKGVDTPRLTATQIGNYFNVKQKVARVGKETVLGYLIYA